MKQDVENILKQKSSSYNFIVNFYIIEHGAI